jgi:UMF1 family MFS transporter
VLSLPGQTATMPPHRPELQGRRFWSGLSILSKRSYATSSFEADDEHSSGDDEMSLRDSFDSDVRPGVPAYAGHDARPTSKKEIWGWYMYGFAAETYVICGIGESVCLSCSTALVCS